jgi:hypothetical protein
MAFSFWTGKGGILIGNSRATKMEIDHEPKIRSAGRYRRLAPDNRVQHREGAGAGYRIGRRSRRPGEEIAELRVGRRVGVVLLFGAIIKCAVTGILPPLISIVSLELVGVELVSLELVSLELRGYLISIVSPELLPPLISIVSPELLPGELC